MTDEQIAELVKRLGTLAAERLAFITIAKRAGISDWQDQLEAFRNSSEYRAIVLQYEAALQEIQIQKRFEELGRLIQERDEGKPPN